MNRNKDKALGGNCIMCILREELMNSFVNDSLSATNDDVTLAFCVIDTPDSRSCLLMISLDVSIALALIVKLSLKENGFVTNCVGSMLGFNLGLAIIVKMFFNEMY